MHISYLDNLLNLGKDAMSIFIKNPIDIFNFIKDNFSIDKLFRLVQFIQLYVYTKYTFTGNNQS